MITPRSSVIRNVFAALALCAMASALAAQRTHPTPAPALPVEWGESADSLVARAQAAGWRFLEIDEDGDYAFHGTFMGSEAVLFATIGDSGLTRVLVSVVPHRAAAATYESIADSLRARFGPAALVSGEEMGLRPARGLHAAAAWRGVVMGLRYDQRIVLVFTCPAATPELPALRGAHVASAAP